MENFAILKEEKNEFQCTVSDILFFKGIGLHTGKESSVVVKPAKANSGITFIRKDIKPDVIIKADAGNICSTTLRTSIGKNGGCISTVEHLMSALWGAGIDNAQVEVYGDEIPAMDGSARVFYEAFYESGIKELNKRRRYIEILKQVVVADNADNAGISIAIYPSDDFEISYIMDFNHPAVASGSFNMKIDGFNFYKEISHARTFGFLKDVEYLKKNGLALGGSLDNALVLDETSVLNKEGLRYKDEFIRHKVLDLIGDLYLSGYRIKGRVVAKKTGHDINSKLVKKLNGFLNNSKLSDRTPAENKKPQAVPNAGAAPQFA
ncbi:MAG: UDP-3-O-acyl-N-acetylglucosamine deacetylase [Deltaproteobacteria bacterium]|jgi:UDP-3-O-[3-hydroxymyristoyl] N-acetylglucosamine deacetylase|nr:UDP-3-O-acyl-N-acetylglucosamine deacetylase [Deltaproteobacteria bacterium]MCL5880690.1 UDP-3-O-acyl-N-acetylglucosamine deacetylase [Deltaproteobacteria bacterium]MDA8305201.1 UDP-3-O-acyl-N-acetylglucosamine deacetylase [Deltaproteobacteria bacterium]